MEKRTDLNENISLDTYAAEGTVYEGFTPHEQESPYWKILRGEDIPQEILEKDPVYRLMRKTVSENWDNQK